MVLHTVYEQQDQMHHTHTRRIDHRIVNIHQPHVRPIVRGKENAKTEFGSKLQVSMVGGFTFIDHHCWEAFNEGNYLTHIAAAFLSNVKKQLLLVKNISYNTNAHL